MKKVTSEADLADYLASANEPLAIQGGGTRGVPLQGAPLTTSGLSGISLYEPGALTIVAGAGTPLSEVQTVLAKDNQRLAFEPMDHRGLMGTTGEATIGGVVAAGISGPRRVQVGACRDFLLGVRFVDGAGRIIKNGGRVMKNVTGYDLVKLMAGSHGTLGVLSEVALKVLPATDTTSVVTITGLSDRDAQRAMSAALGSPFDVSGAAHLPVGPEGVPVTMIRVEGFENSVKYRCERLSELLAEFGDVGTISDPAKAAVMWADLRDVTPFHGQSGDVWRVSVKPSDGPLVGQKLHADALIYDWGGGLVWALMPEGSDVRARLTGIPGHATLVRGADKSRAKFPMFQPEPAPLAAISNGLRDRFDPKGILNPGLMGGTA